MIENQPVFRTVMRGYEVAEVDRHIAELNRTAAERDNYNADLQRQVHELSSLVDMVREDAAQEPTHEEPTFSHLGSRVAQILTLAEEEAIQLRVHADAEIRDKLAEHEKATAGTRAEAEEYAVDIRSRADEEASRILDDAKRSAEQLLDEADRHASARRQEAEAIHEQQRAKAAQAAGDFEQALAVRREKAEREFRLRSVNVENELREAQEHATQLRAQTDQAAAEANRKASMTVAEAEQKAEQIVAAAVARAERIRLESRRELAAAAQRRDSINMQLTNVRQMLATLSGPSTNMEDEDDEPAPQQQRRPASGPNADSTQPQRRSSSREAQEQPAG